MSLGELQRALDTSLAGASPLTRQVFKRATATLVERTVNRVMSATVATVGSDGKPHASVVAAGCVHGTIYLAVSAGSAVMGNLRRLPSVAVTVTSAEHDVVVRGEAVEMGKASDCEVLLAKLGAVSRRGRFMPPTWKGYLYRVLVERIFFN